MRTRSGTGLFALIAGAVVAPHAWAEDMAAAKKCASLADPTARLACYDAAFVVAPPPPAALFGDNAHLQKQRAPKAGIPKTMEATVTRAASLGKGLYRLTLESGQIWETQEADWTLEFKTSDVITISRLPFGGYQISMPGKGRTIAAKRIQ